MIHSWRRWATGLLLAGMLLTAALSAAPGLASAAPSAAVVPLQPPTPTAPPVAANPAPSDPTGDFLTPPPGCTGIPTVTSPNSTGQNIPDAVGATPGIITSTIHLSTAGVYLWQVAVTTYISHPSSGDLDISLISPHGTVVTLSSNNSGAKANVFSGTTWYDTAASGNGPGVVTLASFVSGVASSPLTPEEPLSALLGENPNGDWRLVVKDTAANAQKGRLTSWSIALEALAQTPHNIVSNSFSPGNTPIPDNGAPVLRYFYFNTLPAPIASLTLTADIPHSFPGDLEISLVTPGGVTLTVSHRNGASAGYSFGNGSTSTKWYDAAGQANPPGAVTDAHYLSGTVQSALAPQEAFGEVQGSSGAGEWHLTVQDQAAADVGALRDVQLQVAMPTCLPSLEYESNSVPYFPKLGQLASTGWGINNFGVVAHNVVNTATLSGPFPFQGLDNFGLPCSGPAAGTLNASVHCSLASLGNGTEPGVVITFSTPLLPSSAPITVAVSSTVHDLNPADNVRILQLLAFFHSANGNPWDVADQRTQSYANGVEAPPDSGSVIDGGQDAFDNFGQISVRVFTAPNTPVDADITHLGLTFTPGAFWQTTTPRTVGPVTIGRSLLAPAGRDWLRYVDTFTNNDSAAHVVWVAWGGNLGSDDETVTRATSSGDTVLTAADTWAVTQQSFLGGFTPDAVLGYALRGVGDTSYQGPFDTAVPLTTTAWLSNFDDRLSHVYKLTLPPGGTQRLAYFVYRGLAETVPGPIDCGYFGGCVTPAAGTQVTLARNVVTALVVNAPFCDLPATERATIVNWPGNGAGCPPSLFLPLVRR